MRLATVVIDGKEELVVCDKDRLFPLAAVNDALGTTWPTTLMKVLETGQLGALNDWYRNARHRLADSVSLAVAGESPVRYAPLLRCPHKIWGIGLNYQAHAADLDEAAPTAAPASFMKPDTAVIGPGDAIQIPTLSQRTTAEAELGVVIGRRCKDVPEAGWLDVVAGFTTIIDMTAEDILRQNPRYLTMSKSFDTFIAIGPELVTPDEVDDVLALTVATVINGRVHAENSVRRMTFPPASLVAYHSRVMTLLPGDIISTGTPGAVPITHGDRVTCRISGFAPLENPVVDLKHG